MTMQVEYMQRGLPLKLTWQFIAETSGGDSIFDSYSATIGLKGSDGSTPYTELQLQERATFDKANGLLTLSFTAADTQTWKLKHIKADCYVSNGLDAVRGDTTIVHIEPGIA